MKRPSVWRRKTIRKTDWAAVGPGSGEHWAIVLRSTGAPLWLRLSGSGDNTAWSDNDTQLPARLRAALQSSQGVGNRSPNGSASNVGNR
jgi:hypothetical protein